MKCYVGVGSNLGDRLDHLERAARALRLAGVGESLRASPVYQTPAMVPPGAPQAWRLPFLNAVLEIEWAGSSAELLRTLKNIEADLGRVQAEKWAPREMDLDILLFGSEIINENYLYVPHPGLKERSFVMDPLKDLAPLLKLPGSAKNQPVVNQARELSGHSPVWMGILNLTPDSFSDGGGLADFAALALKIESFVQAGVQILDFGGESTRPGASLVTPQEEWERLRPALELFRANSRGKFFYPRLSVDTRHAWVAEQALEFGVDCINDVSGLADPAMLELLKGQRCDYVLMHSVSVPADRHQTLKPDCDPVATLRTWLATKLELLARANIDLGRIIFDPGIGFGKTPEQSMALLREIPQFYDFPVRILVGHSRKSFLDILTGKGAKDRDWESVGVSLQLARRGVDILRVHEPQLHIRAHRAFQGVETWMA